MDALSQIFWKGFAGVVGGSVAYVIITLARYFLARPKLIRTYLCANEANQGQEDEEKGQLMHHHGHRIAEEAAYKNLGAKNPIWEWTKEEAGIKVEQPIKSVIYGPYSTDFPMPGSYFAVFKIRAMGIPKPEHLRQHLVLLTLDVNQIKDEGLIDLRPVHRRVAIRYVRANELAQDKWQKFEVPFYSDASGVWEYRVIAKDGKGDRPNNIDKFGENVRIFFDTIHIMKCPEKKLP